MGSGSSSSSSDAGSQLGGYDSSSGGEDGQHSNPFERASSSKSSSIDGTGGTMPVNMPPSLYMLQVRGEIQMRLIFFSSCSCVLACSVQYFCMFLLS